jgi:hypothetical protein
MDINTIDFTGARYGFIEKPQWVDLDGEVRNLECLLHIIEGLKIPFTPIYKKEFPEMPTKKVAFFDVHTEKKGCGDRIYYSYGNKLLKAGFSIEWRDTKFKEMKDVGLSFEEVLNKLGIKKA